VKWQVIDKTAAQVPTTGTYSQWKPQLAREAGDRCVYCCIPESKFGGSRNFHVEHYRPKSSFPKLTNEYGNLFYACGICNIFKSDDWPGDHQVGNYAAPAYPDPSLVNYNDFLSIDEPSGTVESQTFTGKYVIERLHLNRPQMIGLRAMWTLFGRIDAAEQELRQLWESGAITDNNKEEVTKLLFELFEMARKYSEAKPYGADQLR
jgi:uncharacterized protein (TIGR02646 family)